ncbi:MAG: hypothetical protein ACTHJV_06915 [Rhizobiaceae bacterium]
MNVYSWMAIGAIIGLAVGFAFATEGKIAGIALGAAFGLTAHRIYDSREDK